MPPDAQSEVAGFIHIRIGNHLVYDGQGNLKIAIMQVNFTNIEPIILLV